MQKCITPFVNCARGVLLFLTGVAWVLFVASLVAERYFNLLPCSMCLYQRYVHFGIGVLGLMVMRVDPKIALFSVGIGFAGSAGLAGYHVGIEHHIFPVPKSCAQAVHADSIEELRAQLIHRPTVRCDKPAWTLWGISMAGYNALGSLALTLLAGLAFRRRQQMATEGCKTCTTHSQA